MKVYQLVASGTSKLFGDTQICHSKHLFASSATASALEPKFKKRYITERKDASIDYNCLEDNGALRFYTIEYEISLWEWIKILLGAFLP